MLVFITLAMDLPARAYLRLYLLVCMALFGYGHTLTHTHTHISQPSTTQVVAHYKDKVAHIRADKSFQDVQSQIKKILGM